MARGNITNEIGQHSSVAVWRTVADVSSCDVKLDNQLTMLQVCERDSMCMRGCRGRGDRGSRTPPPFEKKHKI